MHRLILDLDVLRTFVQGIELGSFAKAAARLGRSTSAVSAQLKKLEEQVGVAIVRKRGRGLELTEAGELLLAYARRLLELNDEAAAALQGLELEGAIRLGLQEDFGEGVLPDVLGRFARAHPKVRIEARIARNVELLERIRSGQLDLALAWAAGDSTPHVERLGELPMRWIGPTDGRFVWRQKRREPLPLVMLDPPCVLRTVATASLDRAGIPWRIAFTSASLAGVWAAVAAGLGLSLRTDVGLQERVCALDAEQAGLPAVPTLGLNLHRSEAVLQPHVHLLGGIVRDALAGVFTPGVRRSRRKPSA